MTVAGPDGCRGLLFRADITMADGSTHTIETTTAWQVGGLFDGWPRDLFFGRHRVYAKFTFCGSCGSEQQRIAMLCTIVVHGCSTFTTLQVCDIDLRRLNFVELYHSLK